MDELWDWHKHQNIVARSLVFVKFSYIIDIPTLRVFGDILVIVNWDKILFHFHVLSLNNWFTRINKLKDSFANLAIYHIFREHNNVADNHFENSFGTERVLYIGEFFEDCLSFKESIHFFVVGSLVSTAGVFPCFSSILCILDICICFV